MEYLFLVMEKQSFTSVLRKRTCKFCKSFASNFLISSMKETMMATVRSWWPYSLSTKRPLNILENFPTSTFAIIMEILLSWLLQPMEISKLWNSFCPRIENACLSRTLRDKMHFIGQVILAKSKLCHSWSEGLILSLGWRIRKGTLRCTVRVKDWVLESRDIS